MAEGEKKKKKIPFWDLIPSFTSEEIMERLRAYEGTPEERELYEFRYPIKSMDIHLIKYNEETKEYETKIVNSREYYDPRRTLMIGIIGAFVPECTCEVIYEWAIAAEAFKKEFYLDDVTVVCVNDPYVVAHFAKKLNYEGRIDFVADWNGALAAEMKSAQDLELELGTRNHRYVTYVQYGILKVVHFCEYNYLFFNSVIHPLYLWQKMSHKEERAVYFC